MSIELSIVSPVYRAQGNVGALVDQIVLHASKAVSSFEIVLVDDGSPDNSWQEILRCCEKLPNVKGVKLSRNFGQHKAITAGLALSKGQFVVVMDCDLQDDPVYIPALIAQAKKGVDIVYTVKKERQHSYFKNLTARFFNMVFNFLVDAPQLNTHGLIGAYTVISRKVVTEFLKFGDHRRHYLMVLRWLGFSHSFISIEHKERYSGTSSYNLNKLIAHAIDGITSQSDKILLLTVYSGFFLAFGSMLAAIFIIVMYFVHGFQSGWASIAVLILFSSGIIITTIGIVGVYVGRTFEQSKNRQLFIIDKTVNM